MVLVGLPGSGKTSAGRIAAETLGTAFTDVDRVIEGETGLTIAELFRTEGEPAFRAREHAVVGRALAQAPHLIAPGGGWAAEAGNLDPLEPDAFVVYLVVDPAVAASRLAGNHSRPLLAALDPAATIRDLLAKRELYYQRAAVEINAAAGPPDVIAVAIVAAARRWAGWGTA